MMENSNIFFTSDDNSNSENLEKINVEYTYSEAALLLENEEQYCLSIENLNLLSTEFSKSNNTKIMGADKNKRGMQEESSVFNKISTRRVPNILKNKTKVSETLQSISLANVEGSENATQFSHKAFPFNAFKTKGKRLSRRRKQKHNFTDIWQEVPNWNIYSFIDGNKESLNKELITQTKSKPTKQRRKSQSTEKQNRKHKASTVKAEEKTDSVPSVWFDTPTSSISAINTSPQEIAFSNLEDMIDFSSNEIFNKFNYEFCDFTNLDCSGECLMDSEEKHNSLSTICDSDIQENEYDINGNEVDLVESEYFSSMHNKENTKDALTDLSLTPSKLLSYPKVYCSSDACFDYYSEDSVLDWRQTKETGPKVVVEYLDESTISLDGYIDYDVNCSYSDIYCTNSDEIHSSDNVFNDNDREPCNEINPFTDTEVSLDYTSENKELLFKEILNNETALEKETRKKAVNMSKQRRNRNDSDTNESNNAEEQMEDDLDTLEMDQNENHNTNSKAFQCLLCPLTFSSMRTMAMHHAGAHGGTYIILCDCCGRLFNRKHHFNRHFMHCSRMRQPYKCDICLKKYRHKSTLKQHLKFSHQVNYADNYTATYTCNVCKKIYSKFGAYENHVRRHKKTW